MYVVGNNSNSNNSWLFAATTCCCCFLIGYQLVAANELPTTVELLAGRHSAAEKQQASARQHEAPIYLESLEDLEHVAHLSLRNFNISDEGLLQSSWLMGLGSNPAHKLHQKSAASSSLTVDEVKSRLALMLESFISRLRNGHLRRLEMDELEAMVRNLNQSPRLNETADGSAGVEGSSQRETLALALKQQQLADKQLSTAATTITTTFNESLRNGTPVANPLDRCHYLVTLYQFELLEQQQRNSQHQQEELQLQLQQSNSAPVAAENQSGEREGSPQSGSADNDLSSSMSSSSTSSSPSSSSSSPNQSVDSTRLMRLCQLVVKCRSAEEMVNLIGGSWQLPLLSSQAAGAESIGGKTKRALSGGASEQVEGAMELRPARNLRDSLSMSLAKLCPLILFQLHDNEGLCSVRRDDRPPMITVWAFATLFVTIVSFCSLIGLSITPLLGPTATDSSSSSEDLSGDGSANIKRHPASRPMTPADEQRNKACLTLFEGLAVGSLVGSALFSLIPQAFELQERESNQGFLLKALIIFFGIYLFFCSERLMRIILDTRQQRKKKKGHTQHRSSNSLPLPSTTADFELPHQHQHHHHQHQQQHHQQRYNHLMPTQLDGPARQIGRSSQPLKVTKDANDSNHGRMNSVELSPMLLFNGRLSPPNAVAGKTVTVYPAHQQHSEDRCTDQRKRRQRSQPVNHQHIKIKSRSTVAKPSTPGNGADAADSGAAMKVVNFPSSRQQQPLVDESSNNLDRSKQSTGGQQVVSEQLQPLTQQQQLQHQQQQQRQSSTKSMGSSLQEKKSNSNLRNRTRRRKTRHQLRSVKRQQRHRLQQLTRHSETDDHLHGSSSSSISVVRPICNRNLDNLTLGEQHRLSAEQVNKSPSISPDESGAFDALEQRPVRRKLPAVRQLRNSLRPLPTAIQPPTAPEELSSSLAACSHLSHRSHSYRTSFNIESTRPMLSRHLVEINNDKQDISTVAWMIILGDGLHNFIDGISIGAAFSESILSGVSISVAVICEEFPHELGDFAVLVSSGMTVHQALGYNFLSACTCYFGMAVGIILGDVNDGASYISALAAGVFLYIALVDMMGELSATLEETSRNSITQTLKLLLLQNVGIFIGISIIFVLSFIDF